MVAKRNAQASNNEQDGKERELEPIETETPEVKRHSCYRQHKRANKEGTGGPINSFERKVSEHE